MESIWSAIGLLLLVIGVIAVSYWYGRSASEADHTEQADLLERWQEHVPGVTSESRVRYMVKLRINDRDVQGEVSEDDYRLLRDRTFVIVRYKRHPSGMIRLLRVVPLEYIDELS